MLTPAPALAGWQQIVYEMTWELLATRGVSAQPGDPAFQRAWDEALAIVRIVPTDQNEELTGKEE